MRSIAIINQKGGVGKTTTAVNLSAALAATGQRVCLIDLDPQAHATLHLGMQPARDERSVYDVLTGDAELADVWRQVGENLWVVGSHIDLAAAEVELVGVVGREVILRDKLAACRRPIRLRVHRLPAVAGHSDAQRPGRGRRSVHAAAAALSGPARAEQAAGDDRPGGQAAQRPAEAERRGLLHVRVGHAAGGRSGQRRRPILSRRPRQPRTPWAEARPSRRASAATSAWPRPPASASRSSTTPPTRTGPRTTSSWPAKWPAAESSARSPMASGGTAYGRLPVEPCRRSPACCLRDYASREVG